MELLSEGMESMILLACLSLVGGETIVPTFDWPDEGSARVVYVDARSKGESETSFVLRWSRNGEGGLILVREQAAVRRVDGMAAADPRLDGDHLAVSKTFAALWPDLEILSSGRVAEAGRLPFEEAFSIAGDELPVLVKAAIRNERTAEAVEARASYEWNLWMGMWLGSALEPGGSPWTAERMHPEEYVADWQAVVGDIRTDEGRSVVDVKLTGTADPTRLAQVRLAQLRRDVMSSRPEGVTKALEEDGAVSAESGTGSSTISATFELDPFRPLALEFKSTNRVVIPALSKATTKVTHWTYRFEWN